MGGVEVEVGVELKANAGETYGTVITVHNFTYVHLCTTLKSCYTNTTTAVIELEN